MNVDKIARLFSAQTGPAQYSQQITQQETVQSANSDSEAVTVNKSLSGDNGAQTLESQERAAKVAQLKEAVASGSYKPDSRQVAASVYKELFM